MSVQQKHTLQATPNTRIGGQRAKKNDAMATMINIMIVFQAPFFMPSSQSQDNTLFRGDREIRVH